MIGYYVHHHGSGHLARMRSIRSELRSELTVLSSLPDDGVGRWIRLPRDHGPDQADHRDPTAGGTLHWAPRHHPGLRDRMAAIAGWVGRADPDLVVVDVSVEVGALCRLLGVPVVVAAMRGDRTDRAHRTAYDAAGALLAPWPAAFPEPGWPATWRARTAHVGAFSRFDDRLVDDPPGPQGRIPQVREVAVLWGGGPGADATARWIAGAAAATPGVRWRSAAEAGGSGAAAAADPDPQADRLWQLLRAADVVVTHAGQNAVAEVAAARRPAVVITDDRPHNEQRATGAALEAAGLAVVVDGWPAPQRWPALLERARVLGGAGWSRWNDGRGAARAAALLDAWAGERHRTAHRDGSPGFAARDSQGGAA